MDDTVRAMLAGWTNFSRLTATAAATLTGLLFIAQTLIVSSATRADSTLAWDTVSYLSVLAVKGVATEKAE